VDWVLADLPADIKARGGVVRTTLDLALEEELEHRLGEHVADLRSRDLHQAGVVVLDTATGAVRAMVGSAGFDAALGQVNIAARRRHPGSALKPFIYALAIEAGDTPASIAMDVADVPSAYRVAKVTQPEHGPVRYREALAGSYNLAAVHVLEKVGVNRLLSKLREAGLPDLDGAPDDYGLRLALGSARVRLVDLAAAYGFLGRGGTVTRPSGVASVAFADGSTWKPARAGVARIFSAQTSYLVMDMLSDEAARHPVFGQDLPLEDLGFPVAAKTGTSRGFADTVAVAVTRELTVAAWAGNFDGQPTQGLIAMRAAAPLARTALLLAARGRSLTLPDAPEGIVTAKVCALSGKRPTAACAHTKEERFVRGTEPSEPCDWHEGGAPRYPAEVARWADHRRTAGGRQL
jgi:penicillin-binding protein 1C